MLKKSVLFMVIALIAMSCNTNKKAGKVMLDTDWKKASYGLGVTAGSYYKTQGFDSIDIAVFTQGFESALKDLELEMTEQEANEFLQEFFTSQAQRKAEGNKKKGEDFLAENAKREEVTVTESGLQYEVLTEVEGPKPKETDQVKVHYHGTLIDGKVFDSSVDRGEPTSFGLNRVIKGWTEGVQLMSVGAKYKFYVPSDLAYGERGAGGDIGPNEALIFEVELLEIIAE